MRSFTAPRDVDDFVMQALGEIDGKKFKSATAEDALPQTEGGEEGGRGEG